jgi:nitroreductase
LPRSNSGEPLDGQHLVRQTGWVISEPNGSRGTGGKELMEAAPSFFDVVHTTRSMRRLRPDPVPEGLLLKLVEAGISGPSAANAQNWRFVIVRDRAVLRQLARPWRRGIGLFMENATHAPARPGEDLERRRRILGSVDYLAEHFEETPALICVCVERDTFAEQLARRPSAVVAAFRHLGLRGTLRLGLRARRNSEQELWATAYAAAQNVLLAARALGLGAALTMPMVLAPPGTYERILGLPRDVLLAALIPVGYPRGRHGPVSRPDAASVIWWDRYEA